MPSITDTEMAQYEALKQSRELELMERVDHWAARIDGYTVYGETPEQAIERLKEMALFRINSLYDMWELNRN